ncbi:DUF4832 domain-containing protein [Paenibacillus sp. 1P07SE]|uniref:DUF4832 domain-containing protein n=1 Tax=Paenibacillus sp. 1P07SE TaxID=3132209 RepID=UPI0039A5F01B
MNCSFSLDSYEQYRTVTVRPRVIPQTAADLGRGRADFLTWSWRELEPERGRYRLDAMLEAIRRAARPILRLSPEQPAWASSDAAAGYASLIRKVASAVDGREPLAGVVILSLDDDREVWDAYADAFAAVPILADIRKPELIRHLQGLDQPFGLLIRCSEASRLDCCEAMARSRLHHVWKRRPVVLDAADDGCSPALERDARRWHAALANLPLGLGSRLELRRLTFPERVVSGGTLPARLWLVNTGTAGLYQPCQLKLKLSREGKDCELTLAADPQRWFTGDIVHNELLALPPLATGSYRLSVGLFSGDGCGISLSVEGQAADGYYDAGTIIVEDGEDQLAGIWDSYYPEGYYPLEDPQVPTAEEIIRRTASPQDIKGETH